MDRSLVHIRNKLSSVSKTDFKKSLRVLLSTMFRVSSVVDLLVDGTQLEFTSGKEMVI